MSLAQKLVEIEKRVDETIARAEKAEARVAELEADMLTIARELYDAGNGADWRVVDDVRRRLDPEHGGATASVSENHPPMVPPDLDVEAREDLASQHATRLAHRPWLEQHPSDASLETPPICGWRLPLGYICGRPAGHAGRPCGDAIKAAGARAPTKSECPHSPTCATFVECNLLRIPNRRSAQRPNDAKAPCKHDLRPQYQGIDTWYLCVFCGQSFDDKEGTRPRSKKKNRTALDAALAAGMTMKARLDVLEPEIERLRAATDQRVDKGTSNNLTRAIAFLRSDLCEDAAWEVGDDAGTIACVRASHLAALLSETRASRTDYPLPAILADIRSILEDDGEKTETGDLSNWSEWPKKLTEHQRRRLACMWQRAHRTDSATAKEKS